MNKFDDLFSSSSRNKIAQNSKTNIITVVFTVCGSETISETIGALESSIITSKERMHFIVFIDNSHVKTEIILFVIFHIFSDFLMFGTNEVKKILTLEQCEN